MQKVNVVIAKRNRHRHLDVCLRALDKSNTRSWFDVVVYVVDDSKIAYNPTFNCKNIKVVYTHYTDTKSELFNKSRLLNYVIANMRQNYDWFSMVDVDMLYAELFLDKVSRSINDQTICVCNGHNIGPQVSHSILNEKLTIHQTNMLDVAEGNSQTSMTKTVLELIKTIYGEVYCEEFAGWGGDAGSYAYPNHSLKSLLSVNECVSDNPDETFLILKINEKG